MTRPPDGLQISEVGEVDARPPQGVDISRGAPPSRDQIAEIQDLIQKVQQLHRQRGDVDVAEVRLVENTKALMSRIAAARSAPLHQRVMSAFRGSAFGAGFIARLGDMITIIGPGRDPRPFPGTGRTVAEALRSDWEKLGGDMRRAVDKVIPVDGR